MAHEPIRFHRSTPPPAFVSRTVWLLICCLWSTTVFAQGPQRPHAFLQFVRASAAKLRANDTAPRTLPDWQQRRTTLRAQLEQAWGGFPAEQADLEPRILGTLHRDGYRVEKIVFQTLPGVLMTFTS